MTERELFKTLQEAKDAAETAHRTGQFFLDHWQGIYVTPNGEFVWIGHWEQPYMLRDAVQGNWHLVSERLLGLPHISEDWNDTPDQFARITSLMKE